MMDNTFPPKHDDNSTCVLTLNPVQHAYYQRSAIKLHSSDGEYLETISRETQQEKLHSSNAQLRDQVCLVKSLLGYIPTDLDLPTNATSGLKELLAQMREFCEEHDE
ncbi:MAG: hypothetical protein K0Q67_1655 [Cellvibrio sp.]|jgi:hypothetical protein|nr:hypothetical protein [Cellvibrio sp.]MDF3013997.1 hypothetical protein [Cellvibrio sp.]